MDFNLKGFFKIVRKQRKNLQKMVIELSLIPLSNEGPYSSILLDNVYAKLLSNLFVEYAERLGFPIKALLGDEFERALMNYLRTSKFSEFLSEILAVFGSPAPESDLYNAIVQYSVEIANSLKESFKILSASPKVALDYLEDFIEVIEGSLKQSAKPEVLIFKRFRKFRLAIPPEVNLLNLKIRLNSLRAILKAKNNIERSERFKSLLNWIKSSVLPGILGLMTNNLVGAPAGFLISFISKKLAGRGIYIPDEVLAQHFPADIFDFDSFSNFIIESIKSFTSEIESDRGKSDLYFDYDFQYMSKLQRLPDLYGLIAEIFDALRTKINELGSIIKKDLQTINYELKAALESYIPSLIERIDLATGEVIKDVEDLKKTADYFISNFKTSMERLEKLVEDLSKKTGAQISLIKDLSYRFEIFSMTIYEKLKILLSNFYKIEIGSREDAFNLIKSHFNATLPTIYSVYDKTLDKDKFIVRRDFLSAFSEYYNAVSDPNILETKIFVYVAEVGLGKTWNSVYMAKSLIEKELALCLIYKAETFKESIINFFNLINVKVLDAQRRNEKLDNDAFNLNIVTHKCKKLIELTDTPFIFFCDGIDELYKINPSKTNELLNFIFALRLKRIGIVITCRTYDWENSKLISQFKNDLDRIFEPRGSKLKFSLRVVASFLGSEFDDVEFELALQRYNISLAVPENILNNLKRIKILRKPLLVRLIAEFLEEYNYIPRFDPKKPLDTLSFLFGFDLSFPDNALFNRLGISYENIIIDFQNFLGALIDSIISSPDFREKYPNLKKIKDLARLEWNLVPSEIKYPISYDLIEFRADQSLTEVMEVLKSAGILNINVGRSEMILNPQLAPFIIYYYLKLRAHRIQREITVFQDDLDEYIKGVFEPQNKILKNISQTLQEHLEPLYMVYGSLLSIIEAEMQLNHFEDDLETAKKTLNKYIGLLKEAFTERAIKRLRESEQIIKDAEMLVDKFNLDNTELAVISNKIRNYIREYNNAQKLILKNISLINQHLNREEFPKADALIKTTLKIAAKFKITTGEISTLQDKLKQKLIDKIKTITDTATGLAQRKEFRKAMIKIEEALNLASNYNLTKYLTDLHQLKEKWNTEYQKESARAELKRKLRTIQNLIARHELGKLEQLINDAKSLIKKYELDSTELDLLIQYYKKTLAEQQRLSREINKLYQKIKADIKYLQFKNAAQRLKEFEEKIATAMKEGGEWQISIKNLQELDKELKKLNHLYKYQQNLLKEIDLKIRDKKKSEGLKLLDDLKLTAQNSPWSIESLIRERESKLISLTSEPKYNSYHGVKLLRKEANFLYELEKVLDCPIPEVSELNLRTFGYTHSKNRITGLGLYGKELDSVPESIQYLKGLTHLDLSKNHLTSLPDSLWMLNRLRRLILWGNPLKSLPPNLKNRRNRENFLKIGDYIAANGWNEEFWKNKEAIYETAYYLWENPSLSTDIDDIIRNLIEGKENVLRYHGIPFGVIRNPQIKVEALKIVTLGYGGSGKQSLIENRIGLRKFTYNTKMIIGVKFQIIDLKLNEDNIHLQNWIFAGQQRFWYSQDSYFKGTSGIILIVDVNRLPSLQWIEERGIDSYLKSVPTVFVLSKIDSLDFIDESIIEALSELAEKYKAPIIPTSAKLGFNSDLVILALIQKILSQEKISRL
ncbi:MAG: hypothetical protein ACTSRZ_13130 [Promethearchaeota archaeon]